MKRLILSVVLSTIFLMMALISGFTAAGEETTLYIWSFTDELTRPIERFEAMYPDIKVEFTIIPNEVYPSKIKPVLKSGVAGAPDVFTAEYAYVKDFVESGFYDDLYQAPYNADVSDLVPYQVEMGTDSTGALRAISWQTTPGGFYYRRSLAKEYLGTDDPEEVGAMLSSPALFLKTARLLKEQSNGEVKIMPGYGDYMHYPLCARIDGFVNDKNELVIDPAVLGYFDMAKILFDEELTANLGQWSPAWFEGMGQTDAKIFGYILPTWGLHYVLKPSGGDTSGDWGLTNGPASYFWGGTWLGVSATSKNKDAAWKFVEMMTLDRETLKWWAQLTGDFVGNQVVMNEIKDTFADPFLNGQNHYAFFAKEAPKIDSSIVSQYDLEIRNMMMAAIGDYVQGVKTKAEAIESLKADVANAYPDIIVK